MSRPPLAEIAGTEVRMWSRPGWRLDLAEFPERLFVYGSLREGGGLAHFLPRTARRSTGVLWGWSLYGYGPIGGKVYYPVAVEGASQSDAPIVGQVVEVDWRDPIVQEAVVMEIGAGYDLRVTTVSVRGEPLRCSIFAWEHPDDDWLQGRIESGDWLTYQAVGR